MEWYAVDFSNREGDPARREASALILSHLYRDAYGRGKSPTVDHLPVRTREALEGAARLHTEIHQAELRRARHVIGNPWSTYLGFFTVGYSLRKGSII